MESWTGREEYVPLNLTPEQLKTAQENALKINGVIDDVAVQKKATETTKEANSGARRSPVSFSQASTRPPSTINRQ